ncbi:hypothetical protein RV134_320067 [Roseovarius sp. EC-HK134]|nr:hypothetical protein RV420_370022 [Roseovarius sp. EC-SD190]VVT22931.1 hypothetical protein RV134_320067 [Roseovarius sp. EC-HK134]
MDYLGEGQFFRKRDVTPFIEELRPGGDVQNTRHFPGAGPKCRVFLTLAWLSFGRGRTGKR